MTNTKCCISFREKFQIVVDFGGNSRRQNTLVHIFKIRSNVITKMFPFPFILSLHSLHIYPSISAHTLPLFSPLLQSRQYLPTATSIPLPILGLIPALLCYTGKRLFKLKNGEFCEGRVEILR